MFTIFYNALVEFPSGLCRYVITRAKTAAKKDHLRLPPIIGISSIFILTSVQNIPNWQNDDTISSRWESCEIIKAVYRLANPIALQDRNNLSTLIKM